MADLVMYTVHLNKTPLSDPKQYENLSDLLKKNGFEIAEVKELFPLAILELDHKNRKNVFGFYYSTLATTGPLSQQVIDEARKAGYDLDILNT